MRIERLILRAYGRCRDVAVDFGDGVTVVLGANEAGKSTSLDALSDLLWGIPTNSPRASDVARSQLCIDGVLTIDGAAQTLVRKPTGLFAADLVTELPPPWNREGRLSARWWRTRLGLNHADLRRGGAEVFAGGGDLADIIFAAREGRGAREILTQITEQADGLFKPDGRAKKVRLRVAVEEYKRAVADRDGRLNRAGEVVEQRRRVQQLHATHRLLRDEATATSQALRLAEESQRVIAGVLALRQATRDLEAVGAEGDRLSPIELADYDEAGDACRSAEQRITKLDTAIDAKTQIVDALPVNDALLDDRTTFARLQPIVKVRIEDLRRATEEFGPAVTEAEGRQRALLAGIGIESTDDLDKALFAARVRQDHAATLDELAERLDCFQQQRQQARDARDRALTDLLAKGIAVEIATSAAPDREAIGKLRETLIEARNAEATADTLLADATEAVTDLEVGAAGPHIGAALTHCAVVDTRDRRNAQWRTIRRSWVSGELPDPGERVDMAAEFDTRLSAADRLADDEAAERSRVAGLDARTEMQVEGLEAARQKQRACTAALEAATGEFRRARRQWDAVWTELGVAHAPDIDDSAAVAASLGAAHIEHARERAAAEQIAELGVAWSAAAESTGLPTTMTTSGWRRRIQVLEEIETVDAQRIKDHKREAQARDNWSRFLVEARELLHRHELADDPQLTPAAIEQAFAKLSRRLDVAAEAAVKHNSYLEQIDDLTAERTELVQARDEAAAAMRRLVDGHGLATEQDLAVLAERARRAADPSRRRQEATKAITNGLNPGSDFSEVVNRLAGDDEATVEQAVEDADIRDRQARQAAEEMLSQLTSARDRLRELEGAAGAAEAETVVASRQAEVARLAETWAILTLQRRLLENVLDGLRAGDTRPLLDHAGRLLEQLTDGRWVALRAEEDGSRRTLRVIRADNTPCDTWQLSEGTADQVFFALRLAAVAELHHQRTRAGEVALPLVLDDVLMAFDEARMRRALEILDSLASGLQIIVFTHHQHIADAAGRVRGIAVSRLPEPASITDALDSELVRAQR